MIKLWLMRLDLQEIPIVKIARLLQIRVPEYDDAATFIANSKVLASLVKIYWGQNIGLCDLSGVPFSQSIYVSPWHRCSYTSIRLIWCLTIYSLVRSSHVRHLLWFFWFFLWLDHVASTGQYDRVLANLINAVLLWSINLHIGQFSL